MSYRELPLTQDGQVDLGGLEEAVRHHDRASYACNMCMHICTSAHACSMI